MTTNLSAAPIRRTGATALAQLAALIRRSLVKTARAPQLLMFSLMMPMSMLVLFSQVFRSVSHSPGFPHGVAYIDYLTPALLAVSTVMSATNSGVALAGDLSDGLLDRLRAMHVRRSGVLLARIITDALLTVVRTLVLGGVAAFLLGFRLHCDIAHTLLAVALLIPLSIAMSALFLLIGSRLRQPEFVQTAGMMVMMPFMFISSAFAPLKTMPDWLHAAAAVNPVSHATDATGALVLGGSDGHAAVLTLATSLVLTIASMLLASRRM
ncbi:ABC transporter permease [Kribbella sp. NPDC004536]|uniref:ABC transporter permease n=1 Tax=Kribbella sp. NPDC004536 TaxID=3364106 RepID=UPI0036AD5668